MELHPDKTRIIELGRFALENPRARGQGKSYAVPTIFRALNAFYYHVLWHWPRCLRRRGQLHRLTWRKMMRIAERWLPSWKLRHPYPDWRFDVMTRGKSPVR